MVGGLKKIGNLARNATHDTRIVALACIASLIHLKVSDLLIYDKNRWSVRG